MLVSLLNSSKGDWPLAASRLWYRLCLDSDYLLTEFRRPIHARGQADQVQPTLSADSIGSPCPFPVSSECSGRVNSHFPSSPPPNPNPAPLKGKSISPGRPEPSVHRRVDVPGRDTVILHLSTRVSHPISHDTKHKPPQSTGFSFPSFTNSVFTSSSTRWR